MSRVVTRSASWLLVVALVVLSVGALVILVAGTLACEYRIRTRCQRRHHCDARLPAPPDPGSAAAAAAAQQRALGGAPPPPSVVLATFETRTDEQLPYYPVQRALNAAYCALHPTYTQRLLAHESDTWPRDLPPWWVKIFWLCDLLAERHVDDAERPRYDWVVWLDSDAAVVGHRRAPLHEWWADDRSVVVSGECAGFFYDFMKLELLGKLNAGVLAVRNSPDGRRLLAAVRAAYAPEQWVSRLVSRGVWAGRTYEQGQLIRVLMSTDDAARHVQVLPWSVWNNARQTQWTNRTTLIVHGYLRKPSVERSMRAVAAHLGVVVPPPRTVTNASAKILETHA